MDDRDMIKIFDSLPFLKFENEGSFGRHYRFNGTKYKVILYTLHSDNERGWRLSYHKELSWSNKRREYTEPTDFCTANIMGWFNSSFEEIFESVDPDMRENLVWNMDLFR